MNRRTVIMGGGISGLLAALAVADRSDEVTLIERGTFPDDPHPRRGAPQAHHAHTLLPAGQAAIEALCPGLRDDAIDAGSVRIDPNADLAFFQRFDTDFQGILQSQPLLESLIRQRVAACRSIRVLGGQMVRNPILADDGHGEHVIAVEVAASHTARSTCIPCDLLIDAAGRSSPLPGWLARRGYPPAPEERLEYGITYASARYRLHPRIHRPWQVLVAYPSAPFGKTTGIVTPVEGGEHIVTLVGYFGADPGGSAADFLEFAAQFPARALHDTLAAATPTSPVRRLRIPELYLRRYDRAVLPGGLLVMGDALCSLNPGFGQGMSVAACQALALRDAIRGPGAERRLQKQFVDIVWAPWQLTASGAGIIAGMVVTASKWVLPMEWTAGSILQPTVRPGLAKQAAMRFATMMPRIAQPHVVASALGAGVRRMEEMMKPLIPPRR